MFEALVFCRDGDSLRSSRAGYLRFGGLVRSVASLFSGDGEIANAGDGDVAVLHVGRAGSFPSHCAFSAAAGGGELKGIAVGDRGRLTGDGEAFLRNICDGQYTIYIVDGIVSCDIHTALLNDCIAGHNIGIISRQNNAVKRITCDQGCYCNLLHSFSNFFTMFEALVFCRDGDGLRNSRARGGSLLAALGGRDGEAARAGDGDIAVLIHVGRAGGRPGERAFAAAGGGELKGIAVGDGFRQRAEDKFGHFYRLFAQHQVVVLTHQGLVLRKNQGEVSVIVVVDIENDGCFRIVSGKCYRQIIASVWLAILGGINRIGFPNIESCLLTRNCGGISQVKVCCCGFV